jgi:hypothetical protein
MLYAPMLIVRRHTLTPSRAGAGRSTRCPEVASACVARSMTLTRGSLLTASDREDQLSIRHRVSEGIDGGTLDIVYHVLAPILLEH